MNFEYRASCSIAAQTVPRNKQKLEAKHDRGRTMKFKHCQKISVELQRLLDCRVIYDGAVGTQRTSVSKAGRRVAQNRPKTT